MRDISLSEMKSIAGGWDSSDDPLHPSYGMGVEDFGAGTGTSQPGPGQCKEGYHYESGTGAGGAGGGGNVTAGVPIKGIPIEVTIGGQGNGVTKPATWNNCTPDGYHNDPSQQGKLVKDGQ